MGNPYVVAVVWGLIAAGITVGVVVLQPPEPYVPGPPPDAPLYEWTFPTIGHLADVPQVTESYRWGRGVVQLQGGLPSDVTGDVSWHEGVGYGTGFEGRLLGPLNTTGSTCLDCPSHGWPTFGQTGNATLATIFIFLDNGDLVASNAHDDWRFRKSGDYVSLPREPIYLGTDNASGLLELPFLKAEARQLLQGAQTGDIFTAHFEEHKYAWYTGPIHVAIRVEEVLPVP